MTSLVPVKRQNLYEQVIEHLKAYIRENTLRPGDRLPTEKELAEDLGVNRQTVREALKSLESMGILQMRPGDGIRLQALTMRPLVEHMRFLLDTEDVAFRELADARLILETALLPVVAERAEESDFQRMEAAIAAMQERVEAGELGVEADMQFHLALAAATKNRALEGIGTMLQEFFRQHRGLALGSRDRSLRAIREHVEIVAALRTKRPETAQRVMRAHLGRYENHPHYE